MADMLFALAGMCFTYILGWLVGSRTVEVERSNRAYYRVFPVFDDNGALRSVIVPTELKSALLEMVERDLRRDGSEKDEGPHAIQAS